MWRATGSQFRKHLMTGVSYMMPFVIAGGIMMAIGISVKDFKQEWIMWISSVLMRIGMAGFKLMIPVFAAYIGYSIADRPAIAPSAIAAWIGNEIGAGFLGAIFAGFLGGHVVKQLKKVDIPKELRSAKAIVLVPVLSTFITTMIMVLWVGGPISNLSAKLSEYLTILEGENMILLAILLGLMIAFDLGGPINKTAYAFVIMAISEGLYHIAGISSVAVCVPSIGVGIAVFTMPSKYNEAEKTAGKAALLMGLVGITEGAIPFAVSSPLKTIPIMMVGTAVGAVSAALLNVKSMAAWGGPLVLPAVTGSMAFLFSILLGSGVVAFLMNMFWRRRLDINADLKTNIQMDVIEIDLND